MDRIAFIIIHFGELDITNSCIRSLKNGSDKDIKIFVIDNSLNFKSDENDVEILIPKKNLGFGGGVNFGIRLANAKGYKSFFIANNDIIFPKNFYNLFFVEVETLSEKNNSIIVSRIHYAQNKNIVWFNGGKINLFLMEGEHYDIDKHIEEVSLFNKAKEINYFTGAAFYLTYEVFQKIGDFDEKFFLYYEDLDYSIRAKKQNVKIFFLSKILLYHSVSFNTKGKGLCLIKFDKKVYFYRVRNKLWIIKRYAKGMFFFTSLAMFSLKIIKFVFGFSFLLRIDYVIIVIKAFMAGWHEK